MTIDAYAAGARRRALRGASGAVALWFIAALPRVARADAYTDFFRAVGLDDLRTVRDLLSRGFDPNTPDERGQQPLYLALRAESDKVAQLLLQHPALDVDRANAMGETALLMAALRGRENFVQALIARGAQVNREGWTALHYAVTGPSLAVVSLLIDRGAALDARAPNGTTPLMVAAQHGPEEAVLLLLERGADVRLRDPRGRSAADHAAQAGRDALARRLRERLDPAPR